MAKEGQQYMEPQNIQGIAFSCSFGSAMTVLTKNKSELIQRIRKSERIFALGAVQTSVAILAV